MLFTFKVFRKQNWDENNYKITETYYFQLENCQILVLPETNKSGWFSI